MPLIERPAFIRILEDMIGGLQRQRVCPRTLIPAVTALRDAVLGQSASEQQRTQRWKFRFLA